MTAPILAEVAAVAEDARAWRHHLHAAPELAFQEHATAAFVADRLRSFGLEVHEGLAGTGVVGVLRGGGNRAVALRADMDALPLDEHNAVAHRSRHAGRMHACGHDGHTAMLLAAAKHLAAQPPAGGTVVFVFQPAEESEGGGRVMVEQGLFERFPVEAVFGMHNWPGLPVGSMALRPGAMMAAFDVFDVILTGRGTHAAMPHLGTDPVVAAAHLATALQTIVSRNVAPTDSAVVSITQIAAGDSWNIIPERASLRGTVRTLDPAVRDMVEQRVRSLADGLAAGFGLKAELRYERRYPATINTPAETAMAHAAAAAVIGAGAIDENPRPSMGAEDFAYMLQARPGCYVWLGNGATDGGRVLHSPTYDFADEAAVYGIAYWVSLARRFLE